jgi:stage V sporulation protein G
VEAAIMKIIRMNPLGNETSGKTAAFFDVQTDDGIILKGFRLVNGSNGIFMSSPDQKGKDGKYYETVTLPKEMKSELEKVALEEFNKTSK